MELVDFAVRDAINIIKSFNQTIIFCTSVRNKQQVYYKCAMVLLLRYIYRKYNLFIAKYIDINAIISLEILYNTSISNAREFSSLPLQLSAFDFCFSSPLILYGW